MPANFFTNFFQLTNMQHTIPDDELMEIRIAAQDHLGYLPELADGGPWFKVKVGDAFVAGAKHQYQIERNRKIKKDNIPTAAWFGIMSFIFILSMPFSRGNAELTCFFSLSMMFGGFTLLAHLLEENNKKLLT